MYAPVLNLPAKVRELIDIVRKETDASMAVCIDTISSIVNCLLHDVSDNCELEKIKNFLDHEDVVDLDDCYDAHTLRALISSLNDNIEDKKQQSWTLQDDEEMLKNSLQRFSSVLVKTDPRVPLKLFNCDDFSFIQQLVGLYQIEQRESVRKEVLSALEAASLLHRSVVVSLHSTNLPVLLVINNAFSYPLCDLEILSLRLLAIIFSVKERLPFANYDYFSTEFLGKLLSLIEVEDGLTMRLLLHFNAHCEYGRSLITETLRENESLIFGQRLIQELNETRRSSEILALQMIADIFATGKELVSNTFYDNDVKVLCDILCQDVLDTTVPQVIILTLGIFERMVSMGVGDREAIINSLETLLVSESVSCSDKETIMAVLFDCKREPLISAVRFVNE